MRSFFRRAVEEPIVERYVFCEPVHATPTSRVHIRLVTAEHPFKGGGGVTGTPLCGRDLRRGWDIPGTLSERVVFGGIGAETAPICPECATKWAETMGIVR